VPLIRLARDKRGIDTLYLLHQRRDGRGDARLRVLYFCAMPQGTQFGRPPLDATTQCLLEQRYPDIEFDWAALLREIEQRRLPPPGAELQTRRPRPPKADRRPSTSDVAVETSVDKGPSARRRRRRSGGGAPDASMPRGSAPNGATPTPIIEP